jgi:CheY-like chemotaxis protein/HPt (histidine-containing phosphotransfer) domain-containing protein
MSIDETSILVIDDDPVSRELLQLLLRRQGYLLSTADSGSQALHDLRITGAAIPQVILADLQMPGISGAHLATDLREICGQELVLIAMSASLPDEAVIRGYNAFLSKPFTMEQFAAAIERRGAVQLKDAARNTEAPVLATEVYRKLSESMPPEKLEKLYLFCLEDADKRLNAMRQAAEQGDDAVYRSQAHAIKGGCGMIGARELQSIATKMENTGLTANHVATLDEFMLASERLKRMLYAHEIAVR